MRRILIRFAGSLLLAASLVSASAKADDAADARKAQKLFFENLSKICGERFEGVTEFPQDPKHDFAGKKLVIHVESCADNEVRIPFHVGEDTSRTWLLKLSDEGLLLKHDHRHADGTPDEVTMYGGWATEGNEWRQRFAADGETAKLIPEAATNVWTLEFDAAAGRFIYALERNGQPRYKAVLSRLKP